jgi:DNA ligase-1
VRRLAAALDRARRSRSRIGKEEAIASALAAIAADADDGALATAARISAGRILPVGDGRSLGVGWSLVLDIVRAATGYDDEVLAACARQAGELAEAFALLVRRAPEAEARPGVSMAEVGRLAEALARESSRTGKRALLEAAFARSTPLETKYLCKALAGEMRIGAQEGVALGAVARAFGASFDDVRRAAGVVTDMGHLALLARDGRLNEARLVPGQPVAFMLATPIETVASPIDAAAYYVEDKIDGVRAQAHRTEDRRVILFARGLDQVTDAFPEITDALHAAPACVLDGEIVAVTPEGRPRPFQALQPRLKKTRPAPADLAETRVMLVAFDLLADASGPLLERPWSERRGRLEAFARSLGSCSAIAVNPAVALPLEGTLEAAIDAAFEGARARGHEGLVLKRADAPYDAGHRGQIWLKVKRAHATLDAVVVGAEEGHGRRAGVLSDYTFAVWRGDDLVPVGKAYSGLTDEEIDWMTRRLREITVEQLGGLRRVRPELVLEVAFDGVQRSSRHESGFALRFPRILRIRHDKTPEAADRVETVQAIFDAQVATGHRERETAGKKARPRTARKVKNQLSLFGDDES